MRDNLTLEEQHAIQLLCTPNHETSVVGASALLGACGWTMDKLVDWWWGNSEKKMRNGKDANKPKDSPIYDQHISAWFRIRNVLGHTVCLEAENVVVFNPNDIMWCVRRSVYKSDHTRPIGVYCPEYLAKPIFPNDVDSETIAKHLRDMFLEFVRVQMYAADIKRQLTWDEKSALSMLNSPDKRNVVIGAQLITNAELCGWTHGEIAEYFWECAQLFQHHVFDGLHWEHSCFGCRVYIFGRVYLYRVILNESESEHHAGISTEQLHANMHGIGGTAENIPHTWTGTNTENIIMECFGHFLKAVKTELCTKTN